MEMHWKTNNNMSYTLNMKRLVVNHKATKNKNGNRTTALERL